MPELPEVEYTRRLLRPAMEGVRFEQVILRRANLRYAFPIDFAERLEGQTVRALTRRGKYLVAELSSGDLLVMHLGMSGWFRVERGSASAIARAGADREAGRSDYEKHDHVIFEMSSGRAAIFNDPRRFGFMKIIGAQPGPAAWDAAALGPEPLARAFTADVLARALHRRKKTTLKAALLDQKVVAGLGNIYVCEALHRARLSPKRKASTIVAGRLPPSLKVRRTATPAPTRETELLVAAIKDTLRHAIRHQHRPSGPDCFLVYDREGKRCPRRSCNGSVTRIVQGGRATFYCPACQR